MNPVIEGSGMKSNGVSNNGNIISTQDLSYQSCPNQTNVKYGNSGGHFKNSSSNSRQQKGHYATDSNGRYKTSNGNQSAYHSQKTNHSNSGSGSKQNSNISNTASGAPVHPGLGNEYEESFKYM